jgi:hypothetical protein
MGTTFIAPPLLRMLIGKDRGEKQDAGAIADLASNI